MLPARQAIARRHFLADCGVGLGKIALATLLSGRQFASALGGEPAAGISPGETAPLAAADSFAARAGHFPAKVKRVIYLFMAGAPSQLELFDYKSELVRHDGQPVPAEIVKDQRYAFIRRDAAMLAPRFAFRKHGDCGAEISDALPHLANVVDDLCFVRGMHTDQFNHAPAQIFMNTGSSLPGRPCMGAWVTYGLGSETDQLPAFVVLSSGGGLSGGSANWSSGFLPTAYQGVVLRPQGDPIINVSNPKGVDAALQRESLDLIERLNRRRLESIKDPEIATRIRSYEMAFALQSSAPELVDLSRESQSVLDLYGAKPGESSFANNCLLARRLIERGVRFVNLYHEAWDHHSDVAGGVKNQALVTDQASAALIMDLKQRGLLDETLVVWGGEFGRTPMVESNVSLNRKQGRDHHPQAFTMWFAGGGVRAGLSLGRTDDIGFHVVEDPVHVHDVQATILHLLGIDHKRLTYRHQGREFRLTDVFGNVVNKMLV